MIKQRKQIRKKEINSFEDEEEEEQTVVFKIDKQKKNSTIKPKSTLVLKTPVQETIVEREQNPYSKESLQTLKDAQNKMNFSVKSTEAYKIHTSIHKVVNVQPEMTIIDKERNIIRFDEEVLSLFLTKLNIDF